MKSAKKRNVQPSIASFLFSKPKQPATAKESAPASTQTPVLSEVQASSLPTKPSGPPLKKQRVSPPSSNGHAPAAPASEVHTTTTMPAHGASSDSADASKASSPMAVESISQQPSGSTSGCMEIDNPPHQAAEAIPPRQGVRHSRLQHKLVENEGRRSRKSDATGEAGKFTPLELQVNDLKKQYPDVLLIIEVPSHAQLHASQYCKPWGCIMVSSHACSGCSAFTLVAACQMKMYLSLLLLMLLSVASCIDLVIKQSTVAQA